MSATFKLHLGDCIATLRTMSETSVDAVVTDPPYELGFMGKAWDASGIANSVEMWREALRVLKPGGHLLAFSGSRTYHRMVCAIEDAGFEVRDQLMWVYGSGFPKSLDVSKAIDKVNGEAGRMHKFTAYARTTGLTARRINEVTGTAMGSHYLTDKSQPAIPTPALWAMLRPLCGKVPAWVDELVDRIEAEREVVRQTTKARSTSGNSALPTVGGETMYRTWDETAPATDAARQWEGWGTALKPAHEPIVLARKPLIGTVAANVLAHGTGALNIDGCRIPAEDAAYARNCSGDRGHAGTRDAASEGATNLRAGGGSAAAGRWPANLIHDGSDEVLAAFPQAPGQMADASTNTAARKKQNAYGALRQGRGEEASANSENAGAFGFKMKPGARRLDEGSAARFFYCAKASKADRSTDNVHPTVKPTDLMAYLCRLVTPPGGTVLDPFTGSGSTGKACMREGFNFIGCELSPEYLAIAKARIEHEQLQVAQRAYEAMLKAA